jgi:hypothetical protein
MRNESYTCDICGRKSYAASRWVVGFIQDRIIRLAPWNHHRRAGARHLCSAHCAVRAVSLGLPATMGEA